MHLRSFTRHSLAALVACASVSAASAQIRESYAYECDIDGLIGHLTLNIDVQPPAGSNWTPGPTPNIAETIAAGDVMLFTEGELVSPEVYYLFSGRNFEADFTLLQTAENLPARFEEGPHGRLRIVLDPGGAAPTLVFCRLAE